jgi:hypothetical protein
MKKKPTKKGDWLEENLQQKFMPDLRTESFVF